MIYFIKLEMVVKLMKYKKISKYSDNKFKRTLGIPRELFELLTEPISILLKEKHKKGGRKPKLCAEDILVLTLLYYRDYNTFFSLGNYFEIDESNAFRWIKWCEEIIKSIFQNMINNMLNLTDINIKHEHLVDVTECTIQRSKNYDIQREYYSGKKKKHTIKIQIIMDEITNKIVGVSFEKGSVHDFSLFKNTTGNLDKIISFIADNGYIGIQKIFENSITPKKKSKYNPLTDEDKELNKLISNIRISIEHVNCQVKFFRILSERYRSRIDTFYSRALIICCFYNICT